MRLKKCLILLTARTSDTMWRLFLNGITFAHHKMKSLDTLLKNVRYLYNKTGSLKPPDMYFVFKRNFFKGPMELNTLIENTAK